MIVRYSACRAVFFVARASIFEHIEILRPQGLATRGHKSGRRARSKTTGHAWDLHFRLVVIDSCFSIHHEHWLTTGWNLVKYVANSVRFYLLPSALVNYHGSVTRERDQVRHGLRTARSTVVKIHIWRSSTSQSSNSTFLDAAFCTQFPTECKCGYWLFKGVLRHPWRMGAEGSDGHARSARKNIAAIQRSVNATLESHSDDPLAQTETLEDIGERQLEKKRCIDLLW